MGDAETVLVGFWFGLGVLFAVAPFSFLGVAAWRARIHFLGGALQGHKDVTASSKEQVVVRSRIRSFGLYVANPLVILVLGLQTTSSLSGRPRAVLVEDSGFLVWRSAPH